MSKTFYFIAPKQALVSAKSSDFKPFYAAPLGAALSLSFIYLLFFFVFISINLSVV